jgi:uncharacterized protein (DUF58 family)
MRAGAILALLALVLLVAAFGLRAFGWLLVFALAVVLLGVGAVVVAVWSIRRRMRRTLEQLTRALAAERGGPGEGAPGPGARRDAIDVQPVVRRPRDGADEPKEP